VCGRVEPAAPSAAARIAFTSTSGISSAYRSAMS
jgi:hypothetical protein